MKINEKIKELRINSEISQNELAKYLNIDQTMISKIENDERNLTLGILTKLSELYVCTLESLLNDDMKPEVVEVPFRSKDAKAGDFCQISSANKIILNLREMLKLKEN